MGKKNKRKNQNGGHHHKTKRRKKGGGYWAHTCHDSEPKEGTALMTVFVSQCDLVDDHLSAGQGSDSKPGAVEASNDSDVNGDQVETNSKKDESFKHVFTPPTDPICSVDVNSSEADKLVKKPMTTEKKPADEESEVKSSKEKVSNSEATTNETKDATTMKDPGTGPSVANKASNRVASRGFIAVKRLPSASGPQKVYEHQNFQHLPNGDCGDGIVNPYPKDQVADKYWAQRRRLFTRYDKGIELDKEGWYSVTPEAIANHIAKRVVQAATSRGDGMVILDAFCGCGGNAIAFARRPEVTLVVCVDTDRNRLKMAAKNASIYNIGKDKLLFIHDNAIHVLSRYSTGTLIAESSTATTIAVDEKRTKLDGYTCNGVLPDRLDCIFLSPPWGGTEYEQMGRNHFTVRNHIAVKDSELSILNGEELLTLAAKAAKHCVYFLPRNLNGISMGWSASNAGYIGSFELEKNVLNGKFKTITCYLGFDDEETTAERNEQAEVERKG